MMNKTLLPLTNIDWNKTFSIHLKEDDILYSYGDIGRAFTNILQGCKHVVFYHPNPRPHYHVLFDEGCGPTVSRYELSNRVNDAFEGILAWPLKPSEILDLTTPEFFLGYCAGQSGSSLVFCCLETYRDL